MQQHALLKTIPLMHQVINDGQISSLKAATLRLLNKSEIPTTYIIWHKNAVHIAVLKIGKKIKDVILPRPATQGELVNKGQK